MDLGAEDALEDEVGLGIGEDGSHDTPILAFCCSEIVPRWRGFARRHEATLWWHQELGPLR